MSTPTAPASSTPTPTVFRDNDAKAAGDDSLPRAISDRLSLAASKGERETVEKLLAMDYGDPAEALFWAAAGRHSSCVELLASKGIVKKSMGALSLAIAAANGDMESLGHLLPAFYAFDPSTLAEASRHAREGGNPDAAALIESFHQSAELGLHIACAPSHPRPAL